jgi:hypothetical protein
MEKHSSEVALQRLKFFGRRRAWMRMFPENENEVEVVPQCELYVGWSTGLEL